MVIKAVIGANYGDEGKGLMTDYFCHQALLKKKTCLNVLTNGGAQRGHTVVKGNTRHVFHHFGSGTFSNAITFVTSQFVVNPMIFMEELDELKNSGINPKVIMHNDCRVSTPYDMMFNKILLEHVNKHNSCGLGVWETIHRYDTNPFNSLLLGELASQSAEYLKDYLLYIRDNYYSNRFQEEHLKMTDDWKAIFYSDGIIDHYIEDILNMMRNFSYRCNNSYKYYSKFDTVVFENAQGLLLDKDIDPRSGTCSKTGFSSVATELKKLDANNVRYDLEVCYVSRRYLTRHGDGPFPGECLNKEFLCEGLIDATNIYNPCQGALRYGELDSKNLTDRIRQDLSENNVEFTKGSLALTHNDFPVRLSNSLELIQFLKYYSATPDAKDVVECWKDLL